MARASTGRTAAGRTSTCLHPANAGGQRSPSRTRPQSMRSCSALPLRTTHHHRRRSQASGRANRRHRSIILGVRRSSTIRTIHCVVPGAGPSLDGTRWIACRPRLSCQCACFASVSSDCSAELPDAFDAGKLGFFGNSPAVEPTTSPPGSTKSTQRMVVYAKPPFGGQEQVLADLGRLPIASPRGRAGQAEHGNRLNNPSSGRYGHDFAHEKGKSPRETIKTNR